MSDLTNEMRQHAMRLNGTGRGLPDDRRSTRKATAQVLLEAADIIDRAENDDSAYQLGVRHGYAQAQRLMRQALGLKE